MIKGIIFDLDGTLLNTLEDLYEATNYTLSSLHLPLRSQEEIRCFVGNGIKVLIQKSIGNDHASLLDEALSIFSSYYLEHASDHTQPYQGILSMLKELNASHIKIAIASNKYQAGVTALCQKMFKNILFECCIGESEDVAKKPAPDMIYKVLNTFQLSCEECLYVGDSENDIYTANNANMKVVGVTWGFRGRKVLENLKANYIIDFPEELMNIIHKGE